MSANLLATSLETAASSAQRVVRSAPQAERLFDGIRAVLFDLDGTLYHQAPMRALMGMELLVGSVFRPSSAAGRWRTLAAYRAAQETLRASSGRHSPDAQLRLAAERTGVREGDVERTVAEWMLRRPLKYIKACRRRGLLRLLDLLAQKDIAAGVLSDYPVDAKLTALGVAGRFSITLCSTDPTIEALKPSPRAFLAACSRWGIGPQHVLVVGDRPEVDAAGAAAAAMPCVIVGSTRAGSDAVTYTTVPSLTVLIDVLASRR
jgi:HAD superfamily hydrolase (TIGR01549 family)